MAKRDDGVVAAISISGEWVSGLSVPDFPWTVDMRFAEVDGLREVVEFRLHAPDEPSREHVVTGAGLREIPFRELLRQANLVWLFRFSSLGKLVSGTYDASTDEHLIEVAAIYLEADAARLAPTVAVADRWGVGRSTASNWIRKARSRGLLPERGPGAIPKGGRK